MGYSKMSDIVGRADLLQQRDKALHKTSGLDLAFVSAVLESREIYIEVSAPHTRPQRGRRTRRPLAGGTRVCSSRQRRPRLAAEPRRLSADAAPALSMRLAGGSRHAVSARAHAHADADPRGGDL